MEKRFTTKIFACVPLKGSRSVFNETLIDVKIIPSCDDDVLTSCEVSKYWSNHVFRSLDYPANVHYRVETYRTRSRSTSTVYIFKTK